MDLLEEAVEWCRKRGIEFYAINKDYPEEEEMHSGFSRKIKADLLIDDRNLGGLPDWGTIYRIIRGEYPYPTEPHKQKKSDKKTFILLAAKKRIRKSGIVLMRIMTML